jgi:pimeloyl-ACP methyl ester carboxylesterase
MKNLIHIIIFYILISPAAKAQEICTFIETKTVGPVLNGVEIDLPVITVDGGETFDAPEKEKHRMVYWIHGLNGDSNAWLKPAEAFENGWGSAKSYNIISQRINYSLSQEIGDLQTVASEVNKLLEIDEDIYKINEDGLYDPLKGILMAHSQGGIVARKIDQLYADGTLDSRRRKYGGIVTVCTPNQGAAIINNQNMVNNFIDRMSKDLAAGPLEELKSSDKFWVRILSRRILRDDLVNTFLNIFTNTSTNYLISQNYPPITEEYKVGGSAIDDLNSYNPDSTSIVSLFAIRDTLTKLHGVSSSLGGGKIRYFSTLEVPISWATIHYFLNAPSAVDYFKAQEEEYHTAARARVWYEDYLSNYLRNQNEYEKILWPKINLPKIAHANRLKARATAWKKGVDFLNYFDIFYRSFIGSRVIRSESLEIVTCHCELINLITGESEMELVYALLEDEQCGEAYDYLESSYYTLNCSTSSVPTEKIFYDYKPSDGVVLVESQIEIKNATELPVKANQSTHMSIRNDLNTLSEISNILEGYHGDFFKTQHSVD